MIKSQTEFFSLRQKLLAVVISFVMVFSMCPALGWADENEADQPATEQTEQVASEEGDQPADEQGAAEDQDVPEVTTPGDAGQEDQPVADDQAAPVVTEPAAGEQGEVALLENKLEGATVTLSQTSASYDPAKGEKGVNAPTVTVKVTETPEATEDDPEPTPVEKTLTEDTDYTVSWGASGQLPAGTYTATITGQGAYAGGSATSPEFKVTASLASAVVTLDKTTFDYDGNAKEPTATVKLGTTTLEAGTDYTVEYKNNVEPGTATATIKGAGKYSGSVNKTFTINGQLQYRCFDKKWGAYKKMGDASCAGTIRGMQISLTATGKKAGANNNIKYSVERKGAGWSAWKSGGQVAGTTKKKGNGIQAVKIKLTGKLAQTYHVYYRVYTQYYGWQAWVRDGAAAGTMNWNLKIQKYQVKLVKKSGGKAPGATYAAYDDFHKVRTVGFASKKYNTVAFNKVLLWNQVRGKSSKTKYGMSVSTNTNRVAIYTMSKPVKMKSGHYKGKVRYTQWTLKEIWKCGTGKKKTPSLKGTWAMRAHRSKVVVALHESGMYYWFTNYKRGLAFHSVIYKMGSRTKLKYSPQLDKNISHGCIRVSYDHAKWIYYNIKQGTRCVVGGSI